ncbi:transglycosylase SLT domain-containing protein [Phascolarctobacterium succinatutens]|uniref:lytic transglycosylase domain-containing protein n=1 Tax=Phascolarctobacterium succinatutens TaxID=626940 RepID=UPI0023F8F35D|nr:transglycosylase SLT domain-containing protein [Phascolarctobacterium succinatutens]
MKIAGYQGSVNLGAGGGATVKVSSDLNAYGSGGKGLAAIAGAANKWAVAVEAQQEDEDKQSILNAMDIFNKSRYNIMYNDESGLMNTKLEGTAGAGASYTEQINKARQDVLSNTKLHSKKNQLALDHLMYQSAQQGFQTVDQYEQKQKEAVTDLRYDNNIQNSCEFVQKNWNNPQALQDEIIRTQLLTSAIYGKRGAEFIESKSRANIGQVVASAVDASITNEDYSTMRNIMDKYGSYLTANQRAAFEKVAYDKESSAFERNTAKDLYAKYGDNEEAVRKELEGMKGFSEGGNEFDNLVAAIGGQESGGNYNAKNSRTGASGKYQIMPDNWPSWSQEAGLPAGAEMTPENQEIVARFKLKQYYDKYGARGAAIAWYGGEGALNYSADAMNRKQGNGDEPSINEYADSVLARMGTGHSTHNMSQDEQDRIMKQYRTIKADHDRIETYKKNKLFEGIKNEIFAMFSNGTSYSDAMAWATNQAGSDPDKYVTYRNAVTAIYGPQGRSGSSGSGGREAIAKLGSDGKEAVISMLEAGRFKSKAEFLAFARSHGATNSDMNSLDKSYDNWLSGAGEYAYDWDGLCKYVMGTSSNDKVKQGLKIYGKQWVRTYRAEHNGMNPDESVLVDAMKQAITTRTFGSYVTKPGFLWDSTKTFSGNDALLAKAGIARVEKIADDWYHVTYFDGSDGNVNGGYLDEVMNGDY